MNNRNLLIVFISGIVLLLAGNLFRKNRNASFDPLIVAVDTAAIDRIRFEANGQKPETYELKREGQSWQAIKEVVGDSVKDTDRGPYRATGVTVAPGAMEGLLRVLHHLEGQRIVTRDRSKHAELEIDDAQATHVQVWAKGKQVADLKVGGFRFDQVARTASTYIRKNDEDEVYVIDGFAGIGLKARFEQFRDKKLVQVEVDDLNMLEWMAAAAPKKKIQKDQGAWYFAGMEAVDSTSFKAYLNSLVNVQGSDFSDLTSTAGLTLAEQLTLYGNNMASSTVLSAYMPMDTTADFLIHSSANPEAVFTSDSAGLYRRIFGDLRPFLHDQ